MSDWPPTSRAWLVAQILLAALSCTYVWSRRFHRLPDEAAVIEGRFQRYFRVDSEHGDMNGWFSPEIVYDVYVRTADGNEVQLWATPDTAFYREHGGSLDRVSVSNLEAGSKIRAYAGKLDNSSYRPAAYASRVIASE